MTANELANKYRTSPKVQELLKDKYIQAIKVIRDAENCGLCEAREAVMILRGGNDTPKMFTKGEVDDMLVRNAIRRLTLTAVEYDAFERKGLL